MVHTKKFILIILLIISGLAVCKYRRYERSHFTQKQTGNTQGNTMETAEKRHTTSTGLQYIIQQEAPEGAKTPTKGKMVTVHYTGFLEQNGKAGQKFDSSVDRQQPFQFIIGVGQVIKGWDEGVMGMAVGEKRRLIIPASLGYGAHGIPGAIPGNATLIFDVELLNVG